MSNDQLTASRPTRIASYRTAALQACGAVNSAACRAFGIVFRLLLLGYFIFCILFLGLRYAVLPNIDSYKADVERMASRALGNKVAIETINASWDGLQPHLSLGKVTIHDKSGNEALSLPQVSATLSWWSLMAGELRLETLEVVRPDMDIVRDAEGRIFVAGIPVDMRKSGDGKGLEWVLSQRRIVIREGRLSWKDMKRGAPELVLKDVGFALHNRWREHRLALTAAPPDGLSGPIDLRAVFEHPHFARSIADASQWKGQVYGDLKDTELAVWKAYFDYPIDIQRGKGSVRAWLDFDHARVIDLTADVTLADVAARLRNDLAPLNLAQVDGRISVQEAVGRDSGNSGNGTPAFGAHGHAISLTGFSLRTQDGLVLPTTTISERYTPARDGKPEKMEIKAHLVDLQTLANFAERLPLPAAQRQALADLAPRGLLTDFSLRWQGSYPEIAAYQLQGRFSGLSLKPRAARPARPRSGSLPAQAAMPAIPGFENLSGRIDANEHGGSFEIDSEELSLRLPGYFADPVMPFDRLDMEAKWTFQQNDQLLLEVRRMNFAQQGLTGSFSGKHLMPLQRSQGTSAGTIDLAGKLDGFDLRKIDAWLPVATPAALRAWLTGALLGGMANDVKIRVKGDLAHFPFQPKAGEKPQGEFNIAGRIDRGKLDYLPGKFGKDGKLPFWPLIEDIKGSIVFDRGRMEIKADSAKTHSASLSSVKVVLPDLVAHDKQLLIEGDVEGALQDMLAYVTDSPVTDWIAHFTDETRASGNAKLGLKMLLPLQHMTDAKVQGSLQFQNNNVALMSALPPLLATSGRLEFNEKGFSLAGIKANFLDGPVTVSGGTQRDGSILVKADGSLSADGMRRTYSSASTRQLLERVTGTARYNASIRVKNKQPEIVVESSLQGLGLDFPAPLGKAGGDSQPLKFELGGLPSSDASELRDEIKLSLGSSIAARYERRKPAEKTAQWRVVNGGIGVNVPAPQPDSGVVANVDLKSLDIDAWRSALAAGGAPKTERGSQQDMLGIAQYIEPEALAARAVELIVMGKKLDNVVVGASHQRGVWQANIDSEQASGYVTWNESPSGTGLGRVTARLASLIIPRSAASDVSDLLEGKSATTQMPGLDIVAEDFQLFGKHFGHLELAANNIRGTAGSEWRISKLSIANPDARFMATGSWNRKDGHNLSGLNYRLDIADAGRLLERFGFDHVLRGGKGKMEGDVSWNGLPFSIDIPSLSGRVQLDMAAGQFLKVEPGAAKLLGVLSLQSLPRRLVLDFRDVFSEGFAFDGVSAAATISNGLAATDNFKMRGAAATVLIDGTADIARESQNLHVVVIPEINVGAASVVYGLAVNPVIGVGTFLAQLFLREPLMRAFTFEYEVTGPWKDPVVNKLLRRPAAPAGGSAEASGSNG
jgi:uncharacterized protein (TIGR02099 family)